MHTKLRDVILNCNPSSNNTHDTNTRQIEVGVYGLPLFQGVPILLDCTLVSPLSAKGVPHPKTCVTPGAAIKSAEKRKQRQYPEFSNHDNRACFLPLACEIGGRWSETSLTFVSNLSKFRASQEPPHMRKSSEYAWLCRWWNILSVTAHKSFASSISNIEPSLIFQASGGFSPSTYEVLADCKYESGNALS